MYKSKTSSELAGYSYFAQLSVWCGLFLVSEMSLYNILNKLIAQRESKYEHI